MAPEINVPKHIKLPEHARAVLTEMFKDEARVTVKSELSGHSLSGSWVYEIHVQRQAGDPPRLLVVKLASVSLIEKEWRAFNQCMRDTWPNMAQVLNEPTMVEGADLAGLSYSLIGHGIFPVQSLKDYILRATPKDNRFVVEERLLKIIREKTLLPAQLEFNFSWRASYSGVLPVNLELAFLNPPGYDNLDSLGPKSPDLPPLWITPDHLPDQPPQIGEVVQVEGFVVTKVDLRQKTITLNLPPEYRSQAYWVRLRLNAALANDLERLATYQVGQVAPPIQGVVSHTRWSKWQAEIEEALGQPFNLDSETLTLPGGVRLPNPLRTVRADLEGFRRVKINCIHGDLNLENILVDPQIREIYPIDFAEAHPDHVLHDLLHLETEVITHLLQPALVEAGLPPATIYDFYRELHTRMFHVEAATPSHPALEKFLAILSAVRQAARHGLYNQEDFSEYYQGLIFYLLGALKFRNLNREAKQAAFWGAATIQQLRAEPFPAPLKSIGLRRFRLTRLELLLGLILMSLLAGLLYWIFAPEDQPSPTSQAILLDFTSEVDIKRAGKLWPAQRGMELYQGDIVNTYAGAAATLHLYCEEGLIVELAAQRNTAIDCKQTDTMLVVYRFTHRALDNPSSPLTITLGTRNLVRTEQANLPLLIYPRNTVITETQPVFSWQSVAGVDDYSLTLNLIGGGRWTRLTETTQLPHPADEPPPAPGQVAVVTIAAAADPNSEDKSSFSILDKTALSELGQAEAEIQKLALSELARRYLLAQLYRRYELRAAAIAQLEALTELDGGASPYLWQELGQLYLEVELYAQAEAAYQAALQAAETNADPLAQAAAHEGLAGVAQVFQKEEVHQAHCAQAETLYQQAGEPVRGAQLAPWCR